jgi:peptidoglycan biosynthesis protein MviN/MurJ (putative lipid II flippase)
MSVTTSPAQPRTENIGRSAFLVAAGIFMSRTFGLVRESVFAYFFGLAPAADAFRAALRIPNILQNLFGEGVLSASFTPGCWRKARKRKRTALRAPSSHCWRWLHLC